MSFFGSSKNAPKTNQEEANNINDSTVVANENNTSPDPPPIDQEETMKATTSSPITLENEENHDTNLNQNKVSSDPDQAISMKTTSSPIISKEEEDDQDIINLKSQNKQESHQQQARKKMIQQENLKEKASFVFGFSSFWVMSIVSIVFIFTRILGESNIYGIKYSYLFIVLVLGFIQYHSNQMTRKNKHAAISICSEPELLGLIMNEMPNWYSLKDVEQMNWFNTVLQQLWPYIDTGISAKIMNEVVPPLLEKIPGRSCTLNEFSLGVVAPKITSVTTSHSSRSEVHLDLEIKWASDIYASLLVGFKKLPFQLEFMSMQFSSTVRIKLSPLIPVSPFIGALHVSFLRKPHIDFSFKIGGLDAMSVSVPGLLDVANSVTNEITKALQDIMVYPTHLVIPIGDQDDGSSGVEFTKPPPKGILRVRIVGGRDLPRMDYGHVPGISGLVSSDPYVTFQIKGRTEVFQTTTIKKNLNPDWPPETSTFEVIIWDKDITEANFTLFDEDVLSSNDKVGDATLELIHLHSGLNEVGLPVRLTAKGARDLKSKSPMLRIQAEYFRCEEISSDNDRLPTDSPSSSSIGSDSDKSSILSPTPTTSKRESIGIFSVCNLEISGVQAIKGHSIIGEKLYLKLECSNIQKETITKLNKSSPYAVTWMKSFFFIVKNNGPHTKVRLTVMQKVGSLNAAVGKTLQVVSFGEIEKKKDKPLGYIEISIADIIKANQRNGNMEISEEPLVSQEVMGNISFVCTFKNA